VQIQKRFEHGTQTKGPETDKLFVFRLDELINTHHPLVRLAGMIDWAEIERTFGAHFNSSQGRPASPPRLVASLLYLQHTFDDEAVVNTWVENAYRQHFCGEAYLRTRVPIDPSNLTHWKNHIGEEGVEASLMATNKAARRGGVVKVASVHRVIVDTTVMPKAI
jgi:transposase, IS5 family